MKTPTLKFIIATLGLRTATAPHGKLAVIDAEGSALFTGRAASVWRWLRRTGQWPAT